jgi:hypothetical protein
VEPERGGAGPVLFYLLTIAGWVASFLALATADQAEDPMQYYAAAIVIAVIASAIGIITVLYEIYGRMSR